MLTAACARRTATAGRPRRARKKAAAYHARHLGDEVFALYDALTISGHAEGRDFMAMRILCNSADVGR